MRAIGFQIGWFNRYHELKMSNVKPVKVFDRKDAKLDWTYDNEADTLYLSFGKPRSATGVDIGQGVIVRWDEALKEVVGLTIVGVGRQVSAHLHPTA